MFIGLFGDVNFLGYTQGYTTEIITVLIALPTLGALL